jgi:hypothetical protein
MVGDLAPDELGALLGELAKLKASANAHVLRSNGAETADAG